MKIPKKFTIVLILALGLACTTGCNTDSEQAEPQPTDQQAPMSGDKGGGSTGPIKKVD